MAGPPPYPEADTGDDGVGPVRRSTTGTPRWVKVSGVIGLVVVLAVVVMLIAGGGEHGPGCHTGSGDAGGQAQPSRVPEGHKPPPGVPEHGTQQP